MAKTKLSSSNTPAEHGAGAGADKKKSKSRSEKAGLIFPVSKTHRKCIDRKLTKRVGASAPVYIAAVVEYVIGEILELSGVVTKEEKLTRIMPKHVCQAMRSDKELNKATRGLRVLVKDKIQDASEEILTKKDKDLREAKKEAEKAKKAAKPKSKK